jgi:glutathione S-transferase/RNA polymerase-associated protein
MLRLLEHPLSPYARKVKIVLGWKGVAYEPVFDSTIMLDYVDEKWPAKPSLPAKPTERARVRMLEEFCDTQIEAVNWGLMEVRFFKRAEGALAETLLAHAREQWLRFWGRLEHELQGREWMNGTDFGRGDAAVYPHITGSSG